MDSLLGRLSDLAYEFFGVIIPGAVASLLAVLFWAALGSSVEPLSFHVVPPLSFELFDRIVNELSYSYSWVELTCVFAAWYFLGQALSWISRAREGKRLAEPSRRERAVALLTLRTPKLGYSYDASLEPLFIHVSKSLSVHDRPLEWRQFYPVAKSLLQERLKHSLVTTYQNKYTFHRSIAFAFALLFWLSVSALLFATGAQCVGAPYEPRWPILVTLAPFSFIAAMGFSSSYLYAWQLFGDTLITETYCLLAKNPDA